MKCYVLTVSERFPKGHRSEGLETHFVESISNGNKIHTVRGSYEHWKRICDMVNAGQGYLSLRVWSGKPYRSKQVEVRKFFGMGIQKVRKDFMGWHVQGVRRHVSEEEIAQNDGLTLLDFKDWFRTYEDGEYCIIHLTEFRYID